MCMLALPLLTASLIAAYVSTKRTGWASALERLAGFSLIAGLGTLGFCLPLYR